MTIIQQKSWVHVKGETLPKTVTLDAPVSAGRHLVLLGAGGALITATGFTKRTTYGGGAQDVSVADKATVGGETTATFTLNGQENVAGVLAEVSDLGAFIGASTNTNGAVPAAATDFLTQPAAVGVATAAVGFAIFSEAADLATRPYSNLANRWRQLGPIGSIFAQGGNQPGADAQFVWAAGVADLSPTRSYPANLAAGQYQMTSQFVNPGGSGFVAQAFYANAGAAFAPAPANKTVAENSLPGTLAANWFVANGTNATIAGYADKQSYAVGETVNFKVDSTGNPFRVEIYRLGNYGWEPMSARNVLGNGAGYITGTIQSQPAAVVDPTLGAPVCSWTTNASWTIPAGTQSGVYCVLYRRTDVTTNVSIGHFVVRGSSVAGKMTIVLPDFTYQAYNCWGATTDFGAFGVGTCTGRSVYRAGSDGAIANFNHRAYGCSFDRPYHTQSGNANTYMWDADFGFIAFAEAQGYDITYLSDVDLDNSTTALDGSAMVVMLGHSEYWSTNVYDAYKRAVDNGINTFVYGSNIALWRVRFAVGDTNKRMMICYKDSGTKDSGAGFTGTGYDPVGHTGTWRDTRTVPGEVNNLDVRRENALIGQLFMINGLVQDKLHVPFASKTKPIWRNSASVQALTTGQNFITVQNAQGYEVDLVGYPSQPVNLVELNPRSMSYVGQGANAAGSTYVANVGPVNVGFTLYRRGSGALVFCTGNWRGWWGTTRWWGGTYDVNRVIDLDWQNALLAVLYDLGQVPSTLRAMRPGLDTDLTSPATGAPAGNRDAVAVAYGLTASSNSDNSFFAFFR